MSTYNNNTNDSDNQQRIYNNFLDYNWNICEKWRLYLSNIYPQPSSTSQILKLRKKFYKRYIDNNLNINFTPNNFINISSTFNSSSSSTGNSTPSSEKENPVKISIFVLLLSSISTLFSCLSIINYFLTYENLFLSSRLSLLSSIIETVLFISKNQSKYNNFNWSLLFSIKKDLILNDHFQYIIYNLFVLSFDNLNHVLLFPSLLICYLIANKYLAFHLRIFKFISKFASKSLIYQEKILILLGYSYVSIGFLLFFGILIGVNQGLIIISHWLFLLYMYKNSYEVRICFELINKMIIRVENNRNTPNFLRKIYKKIRMFGYWFGK